MTNGLERCKNSNKVLWDKLIVNRNESSFKNKANANFNKKNNTESSNAIIDIKNIHNSKYNKNHHTSLEKIVPQSVDLSCLHVNSMDLNMLNPNKIKDSPFITEFVKSKIDNQPQENTQINKQTIGIQTEIRGRLYDDIDDQLLDEFIEMNLNSINCSTSNICFKNTENSDYDLIDTFALCNSQNIGSISRKSEQICFDIKKKSINNKTFNTFVGPLSQRASIFVNKYPKMNKNAPSKSSISLNRKKKFNEIIKGRTASTQHKIVEKEISAIDSTNSRNDNCNENSYIDYSHKNPIVTIQRPSKLKGTQNSISNRHIIMVNKSVGNSEK